MSGQGRGGRAPQSDEKLPAAVAEARRFKEAWLEKEAGKITELVPIAGSELVGYLVGRSVYKPPDVVRPYKKK